MSVIFLLLGGILFLIASILALVGEPETTTYLAAIFMVLVAIYYQKYEE